jgi:hypothetical protein
MIIPEIPAIMGQLRAPTQENLLDAVNAADPKVRAALNNNPCFPQKARGSLEQNAEWVSRMGATRADIDNALRIIGEGPGGLDRLEAALKSGALLPAVAAALLAPHVLTPA